MMSAEPRRNANVLVLTGYFDWFGGYQETVLASCLAQYANTEVIASTHVNRMFSDEQLIQMGIDREYSIGSRVENGVKVTRFRTREVRNMQWSSDIRSYIEHQDYDLIIQVAPGQVLPLAGSLARSSAVRAVLYGDNRAMWAGLSIASRALKWAAFAASKGALYAYVNHHADFVFGYTPNTVKRLRWFSAGKKMNLLPLGFDPQTFGFDARLRARTRMKLGYRPSDIVLVTAGKFREGKRLEVLVEAFRRLIPDNPRLRLLLVGAGQGGYSNNIRRLVGDDRILAERTTVRAFISAEGLNEIFNAADIGVWPSMPAITIQQSLGTGLYSVLPNNDLVGHLLAPGAGAYFDADDGILEKLTSALRAAIERCYCDSDRAKRERNNAWLGGECISLSLLRTAGVYLGEP